MIHVINKCWYRAQVDQIIITISRNTESLPEMVINVDKNYKVQQAFTNGKTNSAPIYNFKFLKTIVVM